VRSVPCGWLVSVDFAGSHQAGKAAELNPDDPHAYGTLGDAYLEVGRYSEAEAAYGHMMDLDTNLYSLSRLSGLKSLRGDPEGAIAGLHRAIEIGKMEGRPRESIAWGQWQLGSEHFALGNLESAEARYLDASQHVPKLLSGLAGLAQVRPLGGHGGELYSGPSPSSPSPTTLPHWGISTRRSAAPRRPGSNTTWSNTWGT
jgi:tetratricopeptide (TPR) repeat protein